MREMRKEEDSSPYSFCLRLSASRKIKDKK